MLGPTLNLSESYIQLAHFEDVIELQIPISHEELNKVEYNWHPYGTDPKRYRFGCSILSLDGSDTGEIDLRPLWVYNKENKTKLLEMDFNIPTKHSTPFAYFLEKFDCGRSHYMKLEKGGHFLWHRDHGFDSFRIIYTIDGCDPFNFVWIQDNTVVPLQNKKWYYINTKKKHCVFSFKETKFAIFNVGISQKNIDNMMFHMPIS